MPIHVHKFGGTSVGGPERLRAAAAILRDAAATGEATVAVSSAMSGVTNDLVAIAEDASNARLDPALERSAALRLRHHETASALSATDPSDPLRAAIDAHCDELDAIIRAAVHLGELTLRARDRLAITGEKLAVRLLARTLDSAGTPAEPLDADTFLDTDANFGAAEPVRDVADRETAAAIRHVLNDGKIPVVTGFCGRAPDGATTTLGRGGSDLSATLIAAALRADACTIWTDVPGVFSADPRLVESPRLLARLHYREAAEMSYYGAKVLHPRTIAPVARLRIPILVRSSLEPAEPGTIIDATFTPESELVKAVTAIKDQCLVSIEGNGMTGVPGVAARAFSALAERDVSATMISQASSEASICLAIPAAAAALAEETLKRAFRDELSRGLVEEISIREGVGLVAAVGIGMAHHTGVAGRVFGSLGGAGVNVLAIAQGSSELNISFAIDESDIPNAVRAIHGDFVVTGGAAPARTTPPSHSATPRTIVLLGCGTIGQAVLSIVAEAKPGHIRIAGVADRSGLHFDRDGLSPAALGALAAHKKSGGAIADHPQGERFADATIIRPLQRLGLESPILIDATDADDHDALFITALGEGFDVVTANKKPLATDAARFAALRQAMIGSGRSLRAEATVGAGLPVLSTIESLIASGDQIRTIEACLSGTLGFLISRTEAGARLSQAVTEAIDQGFTEPDPAADLTGEDVARKAIILSRLAHLGDDVTLALLPFLADDALAGLPGEAFLERIRSNHDAAFSQRVDEAHKSGARLRYVASMTQGGRAEVGLRAVAADSPLFHLRGPDSGIVITSRHYSKDNPLVIQGPGAGPKVTAVGILADIHHLLRC